MHLRIFVTFVFYKNQVTKQYTVVVMGIQTTPSWWTPLQDGHLEVVPAVWESFYCNYTPYKMDTSLRCTTDTFETVNGHFWSALCNKKYLKTEMKVL